MPYRGIDQKKKTEISFNLQMNIQFCDHLTVFSIFRGETIHCLGLKWKISASFKNPTYNRVEILERFILCKTHNIFHLRHAEATTQHFFYLSHISAAICSFSLGCDEFIQESAKVHILLQIKLKVLMHIWMYLFECAISFMGLLQSAGARQSI